MGFLDRWAKTAPTLFELRSAYLYYTWRTKRRLATRYKLSMTGKFSHLHEHVMSSQVNGSPEVCVCVCVCVCACILGRHNFGTAPQGR